MARRRDETFLLYYYEDFFEFEEENPSSWYCLSDSTVQIILSALRFSTWPTRWRVDRNDNARSVASEYWDTIRAWADLAHNEVIRDMTCEFNEAMQLIADAMIASSNKTAIDALAVQVGRLADAQCCDNTHIDVHAGFQGTITQGSGEVVPIYGSQPPGGLEVGTFPEEYLTLEAYNADKCRQANNIVDALIAGLHNMSMFESYKVATLTGLILLAIPSAIVFPPSMIPIAIAVLIIIVVEQWALEALADAIEADKASWVCALYEGENTEVVIGWIADTLDVLLALIPVGGAVTRALKVLAMIFMNTDTVNKLFSGTSLAIGEAMDCGACDDEDSCAECIIRHNVAGELMNYWVVPSEWAAITSTFYSSWYFVTCKFVGPDSYNFSVRNISGHTPLGGANNFWVRDSSGDVVYESNSFSGFAAFLDTYCHEAGGNSAVEITSSTSFSLEIKTAYCPP